MIRDLRMGMVGLLILGVVIPARGAQQTRNRDASDDEWLAKCRRDRDRYENYRNDNYRSCDVRVSTIDPRGRKLTIDPGMNGGAQVQGWDKDEVEVHARMQGQGRSARDAEDALSEIRLSVSGATIRASSEAHDRGRSGSVEFVVYVPRRSDLQVETTNGPIGIDDVTGEMSLSAVNGPISLRGTGGDIHAHAENGPLTVELTGSRWSGRGLDAETVNGPVTLMVPRDYNAELETGTVNGPAYVDFPMTVNIQGHLNRRIRATLGRGGPSVRAVTTNGPLRIERGRS
jgi:hypothetical protein